MDIASFYNDYHEALNYSVTGFSPGTNPPHVIEELYPLNSTWGETYGIETTANWRALDSLNFSASHSLLVMELHNDTNAAAVARSSLKNNRRNIRRTCTPHGT